MYWSVITGILCGILLFLVYASAAIRSGVYLKAVCRLKTAEKTLALTFDDGPDSVTTPKVLDTLSHYGVPAVFFCIGHKTEGQERLLRRMVEEGHQLGNHTYSHSVLFPLWPLAKMKKDMQECEERIRHFMDSRPLFRPPFGVTNPAVAKAAAQLGYHAMGWNVRSFDTTAKNYRNAVKRINKKLRPGNIILLHDTTPDMPELLKDIINYARQQGYRFVRADKYPGEAT
ncbi:MAG: polysaccharide deacetylase family protein [Prevotellaceae bacterium]|jgi:peptidoglycan/xylan/chitin deacetylase (PgdA/CDA1 family)|nr:polysaccharide deacetylase family protein [Prevotellaceae bacterium]